MDNLENQEIQDNEEFSEAQVPLQKEKKRRSPAQKSS